VLTIEEEHRGRRDSELIVAETVARAGMSVKLDQVALPDQDLESRRPAKFRVIRP